MIYLIVTHHHQLRHHPHLHHLQIGKKSEASENNDKDGKSPSVTAEKAAVAISQEEINLRVLFNNHLLILQKIHYLRKNKKNIM